MSVGMSDSRLSAGSKIVSKKENIQVVVRIRPLTEPENTRSNLTCVDCKSDVILKVEPSCSRFEKQIIPQSSEARQFTFNRVYDSQTEQSEIFENCGVRQMVSRAIEGYSTTVFAFGQTGSGKTFTITGPEDNPIDKRNAGIIPRALKFLFDSIIGRIENRNNFTVRTSYLEIYNEQVQDLLNPSFGGLAVRWTAEKGFYVENLLVVECDGLDDCMAVLEEGLRNRTTRSHNLNEYSSRSHSILTVYIDMESVDEFSSVIATHGKISFVDLAGTLLVLALSDAKTRTGYIPYRDSKLTELLSDSLGGKGLTLMIACISPSQLNVHETLKTLRYAHRATKIKTKALPTISESNNQDELVKRLKKDLSITRMENAALREAVIAKSREEASNQQVEDSTSIATNASYANRGNSSSSNLYFNQNGQANIRGTSFLQDAERNCEGLEFNPKYTVRNENEKFTSPIALPAIHENQYTKYNDVAFNNCNQATVTKNPVVNQNLSSSNNKVGYSIVQRQSRNQSNPNSKDQLPPLHQKQSELGHKSRLSNHSSQINANFHYPKLDNPPPLKLPSRLPVLNSQSPSVRSPSRSTCSTCPTCSNSNCSSLIRQENSIKRPVKIPIAGIRSKKTNRVLDSNSPERSDKKYDSSRKWESQKQNDVKLKSLKNKKILPVDDHESSTFGHSRFFQTVEDIKMAKNALLHDVQILERQIFNESN
ncbi:Kinesin- protein 12 [Nowakowskiella sp. JEL0078]|nr:Kinesin- protein 12 [Nowakowskiella sp. JEL0078]